MTRIDLSGGLVLVTGGAGSIGSTIALRAVQAGVSVAVCDTNIDTAETIAAEINSKGAVSQSFQLDVTDPAAVQDTMQRAVEELGPLCGLVTAHGLLRTAPLALQSHHDWQRMMAVNVDGTFHAIQSSVPHLQSTGGAIVTLGSVSALIGSADGGGYTTSKGAVLSLSYVAAGELAPKGIRVNNVAPGWLMVGSHTRPLKPAMIQMPSGGRPMRCIPLVAWPLQAMSLTQWCGSYPIRPHLSQVP